MSDPCDEVDEVLVAEISRRRSDGLAGVYRRHGAAMFALARRVLRSDELAADVVQEVLLRLWRDPGRFDPGRGSLRSYLLTQAHGLAVDVARSEGSRAFRQERWARALDDDSDVGDLVAARDLERRAVAELQALGEDERRAIMLAYFGGFTYVEVAQILGAPEGTIKSRIRAGLMRMRRALAESEDQP